MKTYTRTRERSGLNRIICRSRTLLTPPGSGTDGTSIGAEPTPTGSVTARPRHAGTGCGCPMSIRTVVQSPAVTEVALTTA